MPVIPTFGNTRIAGALLRLVVRRSEGHRVSGHDHGGASDAACAEPVEGRVRLGQLHDFDLRSHRNGRREGEELVLNPFQRLIEADQLMAYKHEGFWRSMDTLKDRQVLEDMVEQGKMPWRVNDDVGKRTGT